MLFSLQVQRGRELRLHAREQRKSTTQQQHQQQHMKQEENTISPNKLRIMMAGEYGGVGGGYLNSPVSYLCVLVVPCHVMSYYITSYHVTSVNSYIMLAMHKINEKSGKSGQDTANLSLILNTIQNFATAQKEKQEQGKLCLMSR